MQPMPNPNNNRTSSTIYSTDIHTLPTYLITSMPLLGVQLRSTRNLQLNPSIVTIEEHEEEPEEAQYDEDLGETKKEKEIISRNQLTTQTTKVQAPKNPPYLERLAIEKNL